MKSHKVLTGAMLKVEEMLCTQSKLLFSLNMMSFVKRSLRPAVMNVSDYFLLWCHVWAGRFHSIDITAAFLQGNELEHEIFLRPPSNVCSKEFVWSLKCCIYELNDALHAWYERICAEFKRLGGVVSTYDNALFLWHDDNGMLIDFAFVGS